MFPELLKEYGDRVAFIYKDFPLVEIHPWAVHAAVDANCLAALNNAAYWDFADYIHSNQQVPRRRAPSSTWTRRSCKPALRRRKKTPSGPR
jgi:protein-disulfide isomerase